MHAKNNDTIQKEPRQEMGQALVDARRIIVYLSLASVGAPLPAGAASGRLQQRRLARGEHRLKNS